MSSALGPLVWRLASIRFGPQVFDLKPNFLLNSLWMTFLAYWGIHLFRAYSLPWPRFDLERQRVEESTDPTATAGVAWRIRPVKVNGCVKVARKWQNMAPRFLADSPTLYIYIHTYVDIILHSIIYVYMQQLHITIIIYKGTWWKYKRKHLFKSMHCVENESKVNEVNEQLPYESLYNGALSYRVCSFFFT